MPRAPVPVAFALAVLAVLAVLATVAPEQAAAQTVTTLLSNTGQEAGLDSGLVRATSFTTGAGTHTLSSVGIALADQRSPVLTPLVQILGTTGGLPGALVATLTNPATIVDDALNVFTAPANTTLSASTTYWVVTSNSASTDGAGFRINRTDSTDQDSGAAAGWVFGSAFFKAASTDNWSFSNLRHRLEIRGTERTAPANAAPTVANVIPDQTATADTAFTYQFPTNTFNDTDTNDTLSYMATKADDTRLPTWLTFTAGTRTFTGTPAASDVETVAVKVTATDTSSATASDEFNIVVRPDPVAHCDTTDTNEILCGTMVVAVSGLEYGFAAGRYGSLSQDDFSYSGVSHEIVIMAYSGSDFFFSTDRANDAFATGFKLVLDTDEFSLDGTWDENIVEYVVENHGLSWSANDTVQVKLVFVPPVNATPTLMNAIPDQTATVGTLFLYQFPDTTFNDTDTGDTLSYMATKPDDTTLPRWLTFTASTRTFSGTPAASDVETVAVKVTADDSNGGTVSDEFDITVALDTTPPTPTGVTVFSGGETIRLMFTEFVSGLVGKRPPNSAFTVTADGIAVPIGSVSGVGGNLALALGVRIRQGQVVVVTYTDPTMGDDAEAIQDIVGNDAASFTTGMSGVAAVTNNSTEAPVAPDPPTGLTATASGSSTINLSWTAPVDNGGRVITGYKIEVSTDSETTWDDQVADTASTATTYEHTGLAASTTRHYRVSAINSIGTGATPSEVANATTGANAAPTASNGTVTTNEDTDHTFAAADFNFSDADTGDTLASVIITAVPTAGALAVDGNALVSADLPYAVSRAVIDAAKMKYTPPADANGTGYASFSFKVNDGTVDSTSANTMTINVTAVSDAPTATDGTVTTNEDTDHTFAAADFNFSDADTGDTLASVIITAVPTAGALAVDGNALVSADLPFTVSKAVVDAAKMKYTPPADANGTGYASFTFKVNDGTVDSTSAFTMTIDVTAVNDAPTVATAIPNQSAPVDAAFSYTIPANAFNDADTGDTLSYAATQADGTNLPTWLVFTAGTRTFAGTPAATDVGRVSVEVTATDTNSETVSDEFDIAVVTLVVPADWSLKPTGLAAGARFRLLFLSSTGRNATATDIVDYNTFVQDRAAAGHADIQGYGAGFRAVGCTTAVDARDNTSTTYTTADTGVPIYWLNGAKAADDYEDFYDGSWDEEANDKNESGTNGPNTATQAGRPWTGCTHNGTESFFSGSSRALGSGSVRLGRPSSSATGNGPIGSISATPGTQSHPLYGLSEVFQVNTAPANATPTLTNAIPDQTATVGTAFSYIIPANTFNDTDTSDTLSYTATQADGTDLPTWLGFTASTRTFMGTPAVADVGTVSVEVTATDTSSATVTDEFNIVVSPDPLAHCDTTNTNELWCAAMTVGSGHLFGTNILGFDATLPFGGLTPRRFDYRTGTIRVYRLVYGSAGFEFGTARVSGTTPSDGLLGTRNFTLEIGTGVGKKTFAIDNPGTDMAFLFSNHGLSWSVNEMVPVKLLLVPNNAPTVDNEVPDQTAVAGTSFSYQVPADAFSDPDSDTLAYAANKADDTMLPTWLSFDAATRTFTGTPAAADLGTVSVKVTATDTSGATISDEFDIMVIPAAPAGLAAEAGDGRVRLSWTEPRPRVVHEYRYAAGASVPANAAWTSIGFSDQSTVLISGLTNGTAHAFEVRVVGSGGVGPGAAAAVSATPSVAACSAPNLGGRRSVWSATLTVGPTTFSSDAIYAGYENRQGNTPYGSLSPTADFSIGGTSYTIASLETVVTNSNRRSIFLELVDSRTFPEAVRAALQFHWCGDSSGLDTLNQDYRVTDDNDADWSIHTTRELALSLPANNDATGTPAVTGTAQAGETLTAGIGDIADSDGLPATFPDDYAFQWVRVDADGTSNATDITDATANTYTLTADDVGKRVRVRVSFFDVLGGDEEILGALSGEVVSAPPAVSASLVSNLGQTEAAGILLSAFDVIQGFETGAGAYTLTSVDLRLKKGTAGAVFTIPSVKLTQGTTSGSSVTLTGPEVVLTAGVADVASGTANYTFTAPANTTLTGSTEYFIVVETVGSNSQWLTTSLPGEDATPADGWTINNNRARRNSSSTGSFTTRGRAQLMSINGITTTPPPPANTPPVVANAIPDQTATAGTAFRYAFPDTTFTDADSGDTLIYKATKGDGATLPSWLTFDPGTRAFSGTPTAADVGRVSVKVTATDTSSATASGDFDIVVSAATTTTPPATGSLVSNLGQTQHSGSLPLVTWDVVQGFAIADTASSNDYTLTSIDLRLFRDAGGTSIGAPGVQLVEGTKTATSVTFTGSPVTLTADVAEVTSTTGENYRFTAPSGTVLNASKRYFIRVEHVGTRVRWMTTAATGEDASPATDAGWSIDDERWRRSATNTGDFTNKVARSQLLRVNGNTTTSTNSAPTVATVIPDQTATEGTEFSYTFLPTTFNDTDAGDTLTYSATKADDTDLPTWLSFDAATRTFTGTPAAADLGTVSVKVTATDTGSATVSDDFDIVVIAAPPAGFRADEGDGRVRLVWTEPTPIIDHEYRYAAGASVPADTAWTVIGDAEQSTILISGLANGTAHAFEVRVVGSGGVSPGAAAAVSATPAVAACSAPNLGGRRSVWSATLTVGHMEFTSSYAAGYENRQGNTPYGSLSPSADFSIGGTSYTIALLETILRGRDRRTMFLGLAGSGTFPDAVRTALQLHWCGNSSGLQFLNPLYTVVNNNRADWSLHTTREVALSLPANNDATGTPTVTGTAQAGETLTAGMGNITDADGLPATFPGDYAFQWVRVDADGTSNATDITNATANAYTLTADDVGKRVRVRVSFFDVLGGEEEILGALSDVVVSGAPTGVAADWSLKPTGLAAGAKFRLLFLSSTKRDATASDIASYNTFVQDRAAAGHTDIQTYSAGFRVVGCTEAVDARDNTFTTYTTADTGVPIYWLNGAKAVDDYEDFYDGSWDDEANDKNESGTDGPDASVTLNRPVTGCQHDGTEAFSAGDSRALGATIVRIGQLNSSVSGSGPLSGIDATLRSVSHPMYGLSEVFEVNTAPSTPANTAPTASNGSVTTNEDTDHTFAAASFNFADSDSGDSLSSVKIVTLPTAGKGALTLNTTNVSANAAVTKAQLDSGNLKYAPPANANGTGYASFTFRVNDGTVDSSSDYTMTINVTAVNDAPTVANAIPDQEAAAGTEFMYAFPTNTFSDVDTGQTLSYMATKADDTMLPTWLSFAADTQTFSGSPASTDTGTVSVKLTASDGNGGSISDQFDILVVPALTVSLEEADSYVAEGNSVEVPVLLSGAPGREVAITLVSVLKDGLSGSDYTTSSLSPTFGASETRKVVTVTATDDSDVDPGEYLVLSVSITTLPTGIGEGAGSQRRIYFADNDFQYQASHAGGTTLSVNEQAGTLTATVRVEAPNISRDDLNALNENVVLSVSTADGTATAGQDYTLLSQTLTFAPADFATTRSGCPQPNPNFCARADKTVTVAITDDTAYEGATAETFTLTLSHQTGQRVTYPSPAGETATVSIADDERPALTFTVAPTTILENAGTATVTLATTDGAGITADTAIALSLAGTATKGTDYTISSELLTLTAGQSSVTATITATMDTASDDNETVVVTASSGGTAIGTAQTVTITETLPALSIAVDPASIAEAAGTSTVTVSTGTPFTADQTISLTLGGTATVTSDYTLSDTSLTLTAGETSVTATVTAVQDTIDEPDETVIVSASNGGTAIGSATVTITDDDANSAPVLDNAIPDQSAVAGTGFSYQVPADAFSDPDNDTLSYMATQGDGTTLPTWLVFTAGTRTFAGTPAATDVETLAVKVTADDSNGGTVSDDFNITVAPGAPGAPTGLMATANGSTRIKLSWTAPASNGGAFITGYKIEVSIDSGATWSDLVADTDSTTPTAFEHTGLTAGATRHYRVYAINSAGTGATSSSVANATTSTTPDAPALISNVGQGSFNSSGTNFTAQRFTTGSNAAGYSLDSIEIVSTDDEGDDVGLSVWTVDASGFPDSLHATLIDPSNFVAGTLIFTAPPNTVLGASTTYSVVIEKPSGEPVKLTITTSDAEDAGGAAGWSIEDSLDQGDGTGSTWTSHGINAYRIAVKGTTRAATAPGAPTGLTATASGTTTINLSWTAPVDNGGSAITGYKIEVSTDSETTWNDLVADTASTATAYDHTGLTASTTRHYRVSAINSIGASTPSDVANATTGTAANAAPTASNGTVTTNEDTDHTFAAASFNFADTDSGDALESVKIVTLPATGKGTLTLNNANVSANAAVTKAQLDNGNFKYAPPANANGTGYASFTFRVNDGTADSSSAYTMTINVTAVNDVPTVVITIPDQTATVDTAFSYTIPSNTFSDVDTGQTLSYAATQVDGTTLPTWLGFTASTLTFAGTPAATDVETVAVKVTASDSNGGSVSDNFDITVSAATNAAPTASNGTVTTNEDMDHTFAATSFNFADTDSGDALSSVKIVTLPATGQGALTLNNANVSANAAVTKAQLDNGNFKYAPPANANGTGYASFTFRVNDGTADSSSAYTMTINVTAVNDAPTVTNTIPDQTATVDTAFSYTIPSNTFSDVDTGQTLSYAATQVDGTTLPTWLVFTAGTLTFAGTPAATDVETVAVKVTASDSNGGSVSDNFDITVSAATNAAPTASNGTVTTNEDTDHTFAAASFSFADSDSGDALESVKIVTLPAAGKGALTLNNANVSANAAVTKAQLDNGNFKYAPPANANGTGYASFTFRVNDGTADSSSAYTMTINVTAVNDAPTVTNTIPDQSATVDTAFSYTIPSNTFSDVDTGQTLSYAATQVDGTTLPTWLVFTAGTRTFAGTPAASDAGTVPVQVTASDGNGGSVSDDFGITVSAAGTPPAPTNSAPTVTSAIPDQSATAGTAFSYAFPDTTFSDADTGDTLSYTATQADGTALPTWLVFTAGTRTFAGTPQAGDAGTVPVRVTASDGKGGSVNDDFDITVTSSGNSAPMVANPIPDLSAPVDAAFTFTFPARTFRDVDTGDRLTYSATQADGTPLPAWLGFNGGTRTFAGTPQAGDAGTVSLKLTATDGEGESVSVTFDITVGAVGDLVVNFGTHTDATVRVRESGTPHRLMLLLSREAPHPLTIPLVVTHVGGATAADYTGLPASVTFATGKRAAGFDIRAIPDQARELGEGLRLDFGALPSGVRQGTWGLYETIEFRDERSERTVRFGAEAYAAVEGGAAAAVSIHLDAPVAFEPLEVGLRLEYGGGATAADHGSIPTVVPFGVGERTQTIMVSATDDAIDDDGESVSLSFVQDPGRVITGKGSVTTTVALGDDDGLGAVTVSFGAPTYTATEGGAAATVRVELNAAPGRAVTAPLTTVHNGGATAADYSGVPANVAFGANQTAQTFTVTATSDAGADGGESLSIGFGTLPAGVFAGRPAAAVVALSDGTEQEFLVNFGTAADAYDIEVPEGDQVHRFSVYLGTDRLQAIWNGRPQRPVTIPLVVTHTGGATEADYAPIPASVTFAAGEGRAGFDVRALFDQEVETGEGLRIDFGPLPPGVTKDTWGPYETIAFVDVDERSSAPGAPRVEAVAGSATSLRATWTPVSNPGWPLVSGYDVQYRKAGGTGADWTDGPRNAPFSEVEIGSLEEGVSYEVQVRAASSEGMGPYSLPGTGTTHALAVRVAEAPSQLQHHDAAAFRVVFEFSEAVVVAAEATSLAESFFAETGEVTSARRLSQRRLEVTFAPGTTYEEIVGVEAASACGSAGAICTAEAVPLSHGIELAVPGPGTPVVTIRARSATVEEGDPVVFEVQRLDPSSGTDPLLVALERLVEGVVFVDPPPVAVAFTAGVERVSVSLATVNGGGAEDGGRVRYRVAVPPRSRGYVVGNPGAAEVVVRDEVSSPTPADPDADPTPPTPDGTCVAGAHTLCLQDSRFSVTVDWSTADGAGQGLVAPERTHDSGMFHFFDANSWEVLIKVLDGCALNGHVWVYGASTTDVGYVIQVTDTATGAAKEYRNEPGMPAAAITDSEAFPASCRLQ